MAAWRGDETPFGQAVNRLAEACKTADPDALGEEYEALFIGVGRGELLPYGSYYLTGFLNEKPLARLRKSLRALGVERDPSVKEPEDHIAALMDVMAGLILGSFSAPASLEKQKSFYSEHIESWAPYFFKDLEKAKTGTLYRHVGSVGREFMEIETAAFAMA
ncbi:MAG TPA: molecular chaperone TorD family protein [Afifellaceae bacterium]|nr:molecular chaperone TorD family protein [Afifellaceae bacterium]